MIDSDQNRRISLRVEENPDDADVQDLRRNLRRYNVTKAQTDQGLGLAVFLKDSAGVMKAGIYGWLWGECLEIDYLWVEQAQRGQGLGKKLLQALEAAAVARGGRTAILDTFTWQAPEFYKKMGYEQFGSFGRYGQGYHKHFFHKRLDD